MSSAIADGLRIVPETFGTVMERISRRADAAISDWTLDDLSSPRIDRDAVERAMQDYLAIRGEPMKPMHWFTGGRSARAYVQTCGTRWQPLPAYWPDIRFAEALDRAWFAGAMRPPIRIDRTWETAREWEMWVSGVIAFNEASAANPSLEPPRDLPPIEDDLPPPPGAGEPEDATMLERILRHSFPPEMRPHLPAIHPERLWAPRIEAFAAGLGFFRNGPDEIVCLPRPALWMADGVLHREDGPAVLWPDGERYLFREGSEIPPTGPLDPAT